MAYDLLNLACSGRHCVSQICLCGCGSWRWCFCMAVYYSLIQGYRSLLIRSDEHVGCLQRALAISIAGNVLGDATVT